MRSFGHQLAPHSGRPADPSLHHCCSRPLLKVRLCCRKPLLARVSSTHRTGRECPWQGHVAVRHSGQLCRPVSSAGTQAPGTADEELLALLGPAGPPFDRGPATREPALDILLDREVAGEAAEVWIRRSISWNAWPAADGACHPQSGMCGHFHADSPVYACEFDRPTWCPYQGKWHSRTRVPAGSGGTSAIASAMQNRQSWMIYRYVAEEPMYLPDSAPGKALLYMNCSITVDPSIGWPSSPVDLNSRTSPNPCVLTSARISWAWSSVA